MRRLLPALLLMALWSCGPHPEPTRADPGDQGVADWSPILAPVPAREPCSVAKLAQVLSPGETVALDCHLTLAPGDVVTRALVLVGEQGSGVQVECNGATLAGPGDALRIRSRILEDGSAEPVHDVSVSGCQVAGSVRVWGLAVNGEGERLFESSRELHHSWTVRDSAPYRITLRDLTITGAGRIPLYLAPGVHHSTVEGCTLRGESVSVMVYLDAESTANVLRGNTIRAADIEREAIALDGSSGNEITDNTIWSTYQGGVYLYRNCGQGGVIRHATPSSNTITGNTIQCRRHTLDTGTGAGIFLGSRDGGRGYCDDDAGFPYGSSVSNYDHARRNTVAGNDLRDCVIEIGNETNHTNDIE